ncbi:LPXTG cell wall anchor domain-containing protein [Candidatus Woesearchaeota archaeon]|nr:LPXTG cell wall anchor domain-containing protein [Candidatus Woesearchaeota archaeon]
MAIPWILIAIAGIIILLAAVVLLIRRKKKIPPDYYVFFIIGITWLPLGLVFKNPAFWGMGLIFMAIGLAHKKEWKKNHKTWKQLDKEERKIRIMLLIVLGILVLAGLVLFFLFSKNII